MDGGAHLRRPSRSCHQAQADGGRAISLPARHLLPMGAGLARGLRRSRRDTLRAGGRRSPRGEFRHLARRRGPSGLGHQRFRRGRAPALCHRSGAAGDQRDPGAIGGWIVDQRRRGLHRASSGVTPTRSPRAARPSCSRRTIRCCASSRSAPSAIPPVSGARCSGCRRSGRCRARSAPFCARACPIRTRLSALPIASPGSAAWAGSAMSPWPSGMAGWWRARPRH